MGLPSQSKCRYDARRRQQFPLLCWRRLTRNGVQSSPWREVNVTKRPLVRSGKCLIRRGAIEDPKLLIATCWLRDRMKGQQ
jgi:hypothetical protein